MSVKQVQPPAIAADEYRHQMEFVQEVVRAIREDQIDALVLGGQGSERVRTLAGADEAYRIFVEAMGEGAANVALDGTILYCNHRFCELVKAPLGEVNGGSIFRFVEPHDEGALRALIWEGATSNRVRRDFTLRTTNETSLPVLVTATPFDVDPVRTVCLLVTDLSEHKARLAAEAASQAKDRFFAALSHELRTPLTPAMMLVSAIAEDPALPEPLRGDLHVVRENLELEARLIDDLLDLSRVISGKLRVHRVPASGHELIERAVQMVNSEAAAKRITLLRRLTASDDQILADHARLLQALWNMLKNAIKFSNEGGIVDVHSCNRQGRWVVEVVDRGIGISSELLPRLFTPFEQGAPDITMQYGGMGLGLAITKAVIDLHDGSIRAHSDGPGQGATLMIALPLAMSASSP